MSKLLDHQRNLDIRDDTYRALIVALRKEAEPEKHREGEWPPRVRMMLNAAAYALAVLLGDESWSADSLGDKKVSR